MKEQEFAFRAKLAHYEVLQQPQQYQQLAQQPLTQHQPPLFNSFYYRTRSNSLPNARIGQSRRFSAPSSDNSHYRPTVEEERTSRITGQICASDSCLPSMDETLIDGTVPACLRSRRDSWQHDVSFSPCQEPNISIEENCSPFQDYCHFKKSNSPAVVDQSDRRRFRNRAQSDVVPMQHCSGDQPLVDFSHRRKELKVIVEDEECSPVQSSHHASTKYLRQNNRFEEVACPRFSAHQEANFIRGDPHSERLAEFVANMVFIIFWHGSEEYVSLLYGRPPQAPTLLQLVQNRYTPIYQATPEFIHYTKFLLETMQISCSTALLSLFYLHRLRPRVKHLFVP
jgi:hypothetical protein